MYVLALFTVAQAYIILFSRCSIMPDRVKLTAPSVIVDEIHPWQEHEGNQPVDEIQGFKNTLVVPLL